MNGSPARRQAPAGRPRLAGLDGVRAVAVGMVFLSHVSIVHFPGGFLGVDLFFVLSGYLITTLLLREVAATGRIDFRAFYLRRLRRLGPGLVVMVVVVSAVWAVRGQAFLREAVAALTYLMDLYAPYFRSYGAGIGHTWSLAVEEQFYLVWPAVLIFSLRRRIPPALSVAVIAVACSLLAVLALTHFTAFDVYRSPFPHVVELAAGVVLACWLRGGARPRWLRSPWPALAVLAGFGYVLTLPYHWTTLYAGGFAVIGLGGAVVVGHVVLAPASALSRGLAVRPLRWLGLRSYGFYLWHYPVLLFLYERIPNPFVLGGVGLAVSLALTALSWRFVELPFLRRGAARRIDPVVPTDLPGGNPDHQGAGGDVPADHGAGPDHRAVADRHTA